MSMKNIKNMGFTGRIISIFTLLITLILGITIFIDTNESINSMTNEIERNMQSITKEYSSEINLNFLKQVETVANTMRASVLARYNMDKIGDLDYIINEYEPNNYRFAEELLNTISFADGMSVYFYHKLFEKDLQILPKLYISSENDKAKRNNEEWPIEYINEEWYEKPFSLNTVYWTNPIVFDNKWMITYTLPIQVKNKNFAVVGIDIQFKPFQDLVNNISFYGSGYAYLVDKDFTLVAHGIQNHLIGKKLLDINKEMFEPMIQKMKANDTGSHRYFFDNSMRIGSWQKLNNGYYLILAGNLDSILQPVKIAAYESIGFGLTMLLISIIIIFFIVRIMIKPLLKAEFFISESISNKDITHTIESNASHEVGRIIRSINSFFSMLKKIFNSFLIGLNKNKEKSNNFLVISEIILNDVEKTLKSVDIISDKTSDLAASISETAASAKEVSLGSQNVSTTIIENTRTTEEVAKEMNLSKDKIVEFVKKIEKTSESEKLVQKTFTDLNNVITNISKFVNIILSIADDTKLLSLNAQITAALAGDAGRGFSVVADEVKKLSDESKKSAEQINETIQKLTEAKDEANTAQKLVSNMIKELKEDSNVILKSIISSEKGIQNISNNMESIAAISEEQTAAAEEIASISENLEHSGTLISTSIGEIQHNIQEISIKINELVQDANDLNDIATKLENEINEIKF